MNIQNIRKGNLLIMSFMDINDSNEIIEYHKSWDLLIPAISKYERVIQDKLIGKNDKMIYLTDTKDFCYNNLIDVFKIFIQLLKNFKKINRRGGTRREARQ